MYFFHILLSNKTLGLAGGWSAMPAKSTFGALIASDVAPKICDIARKIRHVASKIRDIPPQRARACPRHFRECPCNVRSAIISFRETSMPVRAQPEASITVLNSITRLLPGHAGSVVVSGSHGGLYPAVLASCGRLRGVVFSDAGVGLDGAGVCGLALLDAIGLPAIAADCFSARIGDGADILARGRISHVNQAAAQRGCQVGDPVSHCCILMKSGAPCSIILPTLGDGRLMLRAEAPQIWGVDSNSLIEPADVGAIIVSGSHGGLLGGEPGSAIGPDVLAAAFNDAGVGIDNAGISRLAALDRRGIAAVTVAAASARIGDARSAWETGVISAWNETAARLGAGEGRRLSAFYSDLASRVSPELVAGHLNCDKHRQRASEP